MPLTVATLNVLNTADRWDDRRPLIVGEFARLRPDLFAIQEVDFASDQDHRLADAGAEAYAVFRAPEKPGFGNALLVRRSALASLPEDEPAHVVPLPGGRAGVLVELHLADGRAIVAGTTHLAWEPDRPRRRLEQVERLLARLDELAPHPVILTGDFNATTDEPAVGRMREAGFTSAYAAVHGEEPDWTYPSPGTPPEIAVRRPGCIDYVWVRGLRVDGAQTGFDMPGASGLYPSDHRAVIAQLA